ncbi:Hsp70 family protein [Leptolyngbya sp. FACHB-261]|uniref:Hsp70 family protein n=1 Tax=Leptolyngbya sp. FACHB-261 TaxID=2692806 RepID=UPI0016841216|nr:Hsp70 family protein [Leptolyngbya sp. FACHB-261]MBD2099714.1 Hsp70 family protein [Leptolyngbya sp. FACHB-261]
MSYAIDFGTSNTVVARWNAATREPETLKLPGLSVTQANNPPLIPSLVYVEDAANECILTGQLVRDRGLDLSMDARFFRSFKRGIGSSIQGFLPELDGRTVSFEQVGAWFLRQVLEQVQKTGPTDSIVFTVPVDSFEPYRHWLGQVVSAQGPAALPVEQVRLLDEPTAAALGYGLQAGEQLLVIDFGGGTLDLAWVQLNLEANGSKPLGFVLKWGEKLFAEKSGQRPKVARVMAKAGMNLGGTDLDNWLVDYFAQTQELPRNSLITRLAERLKIQLSARPKASEVYFNDETLESYDLSLERSQFEQILEERGFFAGLEETVTQVLQQAQRQGLTANDLDHVLLVGGTAQIPAVQNWVRERFGSDKVRGEKPFEAIAHGALQISQGVELKDFLYHSYGVRYWDRRNNCHSWHPLIPAGQAYPMSQPVELVLGASLESQPSIELVIGELGSESKAAEVFFDGDRLITRTSSQAQTQVQPLNDRDGARSIAQLNPPGYPGSDRIRVLFQVDVRRTLRITVEDILTGDTLLEDREVVELS